MREDTPPVGVFVYLQTGQSLSKVIIFCPYKQLTEDLLHKNEVHVSSEVRALGDYKFYRSTRIPKVHLLLSSLSNLDLAKLNEVNCLVEILPVKKMNELDFNREYKIKELK
ncbi:uncharacterized protein LOC141535154 [Cotesia typhae]|uniref:uncharacterized protein LOC141535154 n=1 Tax=Cotesia typhae TaxID=2053667 RepID=UPI003D68AD00